MLLNLSCLCGNISIFQYLQPFCNNINYFELLEYASYGGCLQIAQCRCQSFISESRQIIPSFFWAFSKSRFSIIKYFIEHNYLRFFTKDELIFVINVCLLYGSPSILNHLLQLCPDYTLEQFVTPNKNIKIKYTSLKIVKTVIKKFGNQIKLHCPYFNSVFSISWKYKLFVILLLVLSIFSSDISYALFFKKISSKIIIPPFLIERLSPKQLCLDRFIVESIVQLFLKNPLQIFEAMTAHYFVFDRSTIEEFGLLNFCVEQISLEKIKFLQQYNPNLDITPKSALYLIESSFLYSSSHLFDEFPRPTDFSPREFCLLFFLVQLRNHRKNLIIKSFRILKQIYYKDSDFTDVENQLFLQRFDIIQVICYVFFSFLNQTNFSFLIEVPINLVTQNQICNYFSDLHNLQSMPFIFAFILPTMKEFIFKQMISKIPIDTCSIEKIQRFLILLIEFSYPPYFIEIVFKHCLYFKTPIIDFSLIIQKLFSSNCVETINHIFNNFPEIYQVALKSISKITQLPKSYFINNYWKLDKPSYIPGERSLVFRPREDDYYAYVPENAFIRNIGCYMFSANGKCIV
jgi:hypothetical protein